MKTNPLKPHLQKTGLLIGLAVLYTFLFHKMELGLNVFLFDAVFMLCLLRIRPELSQQSSFTWSLIGLFFAAGCVVVVNSALSVFAHAISFLLILGFSQKQELRFIWFGLLLGLFSFFQGPFRWFKQSVISFKGEGNQELKPALRWLRQGLIPAMIIIPFLVLYVSASEGLATGIDQILSILENIKIDESLIVNCMLFFWGALLVVSALFPRTRVSLLAKFAATFTDKLRRERQGNTPYMGTPKIMALKDEYRKAILTFGALNFLLLLVNLIDFSQVWFPQEGLSAAVLSQFVHTGTYSLIASILLAMVVVLYFFRGNLNFFAPAATLLKQLTFAWIAQNALLAISVGVRNWHYIHAYGLAYGRVLVAFFLLLILIGLYTLFRKVDDRLSLSYLFQNNGLAAWLCLLLFAAINWDVVITRYNIRTQANTTVDWSYLIDDLSDANAFLLAKAPVPAHLAKYPLSRKLDSNRHQVADWRSWNYPDWRNTRALKHLKATNDEE